MSLCGFVQTVREKLRHNSSINDAGEIQSYRKAITEAEIETGSKKKTETETQAEKETETETYTQGDTGRDGMKNLLTG